MIPSSRTLVPALVFAATVAANSAPPPAQPEPEATGSAVERPAGERTELRPSQETVRPEKRPVRVILPSPYSGKR